MMDQIIEDFNEIRDALMVCEREYKLYPRKSLTQLMTRLCAAVIEFSANVTSYLSQSTSKRMIQSYAEER